jgi:hypothetical protein
LAEIFNERTAKFLQPTQDIFQVISNNVLPIFELIYNQFQQFAVNIFGTHARSMAEFLLTYH